MHKQNHKSCIHNCLCYVIFYFFFFKQKTAYEMRISDWSSDVCSSDLAGVAEAVDVLGESAAAGLAGQREPALEVVAGHRRARGQRVVGEVEQRAGVGAVHQRGETELAAGHVAVRSEEHTSELQSLMRISYAVFCLKKKKKTIHH